MWYSNILFCVSASFLILIFAILWNTYAEISILWYNLFQFIMVENWHIYISQLPASSLVQQKKYNLNISPFTQPKIELQPDILYVLCTYCVLIVLTVILIESFFISVHGFAVQWPCNCTLYTTVNNCMRERDFLNLQKYQKRNLFYGKKRGLIIHLYPLSLEKVIYDSK